MGHDLDRAAEIFAMPAEEAWQACGGPARVALWADWIVRRFRRLYGNDRGEKTPVRTDGRLILAASSHRGFVKDLEITDVVFDSDGRLASYFVNGRTMDETVSVVGTSLCGKGVLVAERRDPLLPYLHLVLVDVGSFTQPMDGPWRKRLFASFGDDHRVTFDGETVPIFLDDDIAKVGRDGFVGVFDRRLPAIASRSLDLVSGLDIVGRDGVVWMSFRRGDADSEGA